MIFLLLNFYIVVSHYLFISRSGIKSLRDKIISISITLSCQIILTQTILGSFALLTPGYLAVFNIIISTTLVSLYFFKSRQHNHFFINEDIKAINSFLPNIFTPYNLFVSLLSIIAAIWIIIAAFLLPPRGVDDLVYHLPAIFEYIKSQEIFLLPTNFAVHFAFPMNAELLFMLPLNYIKSTTSLGLTQFIYSIIGMFAVFGLARTLKISAKISYFCSHLFFLTPLVLLQSGSGYIGIIISVFIFLSLYQLVRLYESQNRVHLFLFGMSAGLMIGMKYTLFLNLFMFFILLAPLLLKRSRLEISVLLLIILSCCCYWYIRNLAYFGDPVYPLLSPEAIHLKLPKTAGFYTQLADLYTKIKLLFTTDDGIGSLHGGYGLYFWSAAVPAWIYLFIRCLKTNIQNRTTEIIIWSQLLIGIAIIILIPVDRIKFQARYFLFVIGIGSLAIGSIISHFRYKTYQIGIIILCCVSALFSLTQLAISQLPSYSIDIPIKDKINKADYAKLRYIRLSSSMNSMGFLWETLDFTTRHHEKGLNVYFAMSYYPFAASFYGSKLQNRVWNFDRNNENMPDAFLFFESAPSRIKYIKRKFTSAQLMSNHDYELVDRSGYSYFFLNKKFLADDSAIYNSLLEHYKRYFINEIESAKLLVPYLDKDTPVITSHYIGFGLRYLKYTNIINNEIYTLPVGKEKEFINILDSKNFYTINKFIENHEASVKHKFNFNKESIALILNQ